MSDNLSETLPELQRVLSILHDRECVALGIPTASLLCVVDASLDVNARVEAGHTPCIRFSYTWTMQCVLDEKTDLIVKALRRCIMIGYNKLRWGIGKRRSKVAAEYIEKAKVFRLKAGDNFSLPVKDFRRTFSVKLCDPMTGEVEERHDVREEELEYVQKEMATILTAKVYSHTQVAALLDLLHAHKLAIQEPADVESIDVIQIAKDHRIEAMHYVDCEMMGEEGE